MNFQVENRTLQAAIAARLEAEPNGRAIAFYDKTGSFAWHTCEQFYTKAAGYAAALTERGLAPGEVCMLVLPSGEFSATLVLATLLAGGLPLLLAPPSLQSEGAFSSLAEVIHHTVGKASPRILVLPESMAGQEAEFAGRPAEMDVLVGKSELAPLSGSPIPTIIPGEGDRAAMQLTSGTTGMPRVAVWKQYKVLNALDGMVAAMKLGSDDVCLNWTPLYHDMGLVNNFLLCMAKGIPLVMMDPVDFVKRPALWLRSLSDTGATVTWSPNFGFAIAAQRVRDRELEGVRLDGVRGMWNAAERIHYETMTAFYERFAPYGLRFEALKTNFGCVENIGGATFSDADGAFVVEFIDPLSQQQGVARRVSDPEAEESAVPIVGVGRPYPGMEIKILSSQGEHLPEGRIGDIALDSPSRMEGYVDEPEANAYALYGDLIRTGDVGYMRNGQLFWVGRSRERINVRGAKLDPSDFEPILLEVSGLRQGSFVAFGVDDPELGTQRVVVATEVRRSTTRTPEEIKKEIRAQVFERLGVNVSEVMLVQRGTLTKTSSGKRRHRHFRDRYLRGELDEYEWQPLQASV